VSKVGAIKLDCAVVRFYAKETVEVTF